MTQDATSGDAISAGALSQVVGGECLRVLFRKVLPSMAQAGLKPARLVVK